MPPFKPHTTAAASPTAANASLSCSSPATASYCPRGRPVPHPAMRANCPSSSWQPHHPLPTANEDQQEQAVFSPTGVASPLSFPRLCKPPSVPRHSPYPTDILPPAPAPPLATADATPPAPHIAICRSSPLPAALRVVGEGRRLSPAPPPAIRPHIQRIFHLLRLHRP